MKKFERLSNELAALIDRGILAPDTRLPSVRDLVRERGLSADTVYRAYHQLEGQGHIHARPRSGYFVNGKIRPRSSTANTTRPPGNLPDNSCSDAFVTSLYERLLDPNTATFGASYPNANLYPYAALARSLAAAARTLKPNLFNSGLSNGHGQLLAQIAARYRTRGVAVEPHQIMITGGASEALALSLQSLTRPGDLVLIEDPCFYGSMHLLRRLQLRHALVPVDAVNGLDLDTLATLLQRHAPRACLLMTTLQHPTGTSLPSVKKRALVALLARHGIPLVEDDVYGELNFSQIPSPPALAYDEAGLVLNCGSFSKSLAPGYRIGWVAAPAALIERIKTLRLTSSITPSIPVQAGLAHYLQRGVYDHHLRGLRRALELQQRQMLEQIHSYFPADCSLTPHAGGYYLWLRLPPGRNAWDIAQRALGEGISVMPGCVLSACSRFNDHLRLNYGHVLDERATKSLRTLGALAT